jgi:HSP20 family molecular chaperone IbpA
VSVLEQEQALRVEYRKRGTDFKQDFMLPNQVDFENIEASLQDGLLEITLPRVKQKIRTVLLAGKSQKQLESPVEQAS